MRGGSCGGSGLIVSCSIGLGLAIFLLFGTSARFVRRIGSKYAKNGTMSLILNV